MFGLFLLILFNKDLYNSLNLRRLPVYVKYKYSFVVISVLSGHPKRSTKIVFEDRLLLNQG